MYSYETPEEAIVRLYNNGNSRRKIRELVKCGSKRINYAISYFKKNGEIPIKKKKQDDQLRPQMMY